MTVKPDENKQKKWLQEVTTHQLEHTNLIKSGSGSSSVRQDPSLAELHLLSCDIEEVERINQELLEKHNTKHAVFRASLISKKPDDPPSRRRAVALAICAKYVLERGIFSLVYR